MAGIEISKPPFDFKAGSILLFNKPKNWSSFQLVKKVRNTINTKTGHAGTLDPLATGLMILATGKFTKKLGELQGLDKKYIATIGLGGITSSYDLETEIENKVDVQQLTEEEIKPMLDSFIGEQAQIPPMFSAIKKDGKKLYELARAGKEVKRHPREIIIHSIEIQEIALPHITIEVHCSKGTYIRSLANDIGKKLNVGGYLQELKRTAIGPYSLNNAYEIMAFVDLIKSG